MRYILREVEKYKWKTAEEMVSRTCGKCCFHSNKNTEGMIAIYGGYYCSIRKSELAHRELMCGLYGYFVKQSLNVNTKVI